MQHFTWINEKEHEQWASKVQYDDGPYPPEPIAIWLCDKCGSNDCNFHISTKESEDSHMRCNNCHSTEAV